MIALSTLSSRCLYDWCPLIGSRPIIEERKRIFVATGLSAAGVLAAVMGILS